MRPEVLVPLLIGCAMLWWIGRGISLMARLLTVVVTLGLIAAIIFIERGAH